MNAQDIRYNIVMELVRQEGSIDIDDVEKLTQFILAGPPATVPEEVA